MKLQINSKGAWRDLIDFAVEEVESVKVRSVALMIVSANAGRIPDLRICDSMRCVLIWTFNEGWYVPHFAEGHAWVP